jgi:hypothetical protein
MSIGLLNDGDFAEWSEVWRQYLEFYKAILPEEQYKNTWSRIQAPDGDLHAFVLRDDQGKIIGLSHYLFHTQTWTDKLDCYLNGKRSSKPPPPPPARQSQHNRNNP